MRPGGSSSHDLFGRWQCTFCPLIDTWLSPRGSHLGEVRVVGIEVTFLDEDHLVIGHVLDGDHSTN